MSKKAQEEKEEKEIEEVTPDIENEGDFEDEDFSSSEEEIKPMADLDPEMEIWPDGPKAKDLTAWMEQHKSVYLTSISMDEHIVWRPLKRSEYARISSHLENLPVDMSETEINMQNEELICKTCVLAPDYTNQDFDELLAGIPTLIAQQIMERSGFSAIGLREMV